MTDVAAIIGNYQGENLLPDCLASLERQSQPPTEVIVVDGSSTDDSVGIAESHGAHIVRCPNRGLGYLYNRGAETAATPHVLFLNNDVALEPDCVAELSHALGADSSRFAADARQLDWAGENTIHARTVLTRGHLLHEYLPGLHLDPVVRADRLSSTVCANGAAMLVRRDRHLELGGFDETFFMEWEDLDLCWRAWLRGWPTVYVPMAVVRHRVGAATPAQAVSRRQASSHHNIMRFALKCLPSAAAVRVVVGELLRLPAHPAAISRGLGAVIAEWPEIMRCRRRLGETRDVFDHLLAMPGALDDRLP